MSISATSDFQARHLPTSSHPLPPRWRIWKRNWCDMYQGAKKDAHPFSRPPCIQSRTRSPFSVSTFPFNTD